MDTAVVGARMDMLGQMDILVARAMQDMWEVQDMLVVKVFPVRLANMQIPYWVVLELQ
jgi:hypothetical protein